MKNVVMRLLFTFVIAVSVMLCCAIPSLALTDGEWEFQLLNDEVKITKYLGEGGDVTVPEQIYGCPVTKIEPRIFDAVLNDIKTIAYPPTIKKIEPLGWDSVDRHGPETVILPEGITQIAGDAFSRCVNLKAIQLPSTIERIGSCAFEGCSSLSYINLHDSIKAIGDGAFSGTGIKKADLSHLTNIQLGSYIFKDCYQLEEILFPENLTSIPDSFACGCHMVTEIEIPSSVTKIEAFAFHGTSLSKVILPSGLKELDQAVFGDTKLQELVIPYGTEKVGAVFAHPFGFGDDCTTIQFIYVPDTVTSLKSSLGNIASKCPNAIIYCSSGSYAENFCKKNEISYLTDNSVNSGITVLYNGSRVSFHSYGQNPELYNGRTLVPLRSIFEAMGAKVSWNQETQTATATRGNTTVTITIGQSEIYKNGKAIALDVPAMLIGGRTMVPARVIAEAFGANVEWNQNGRVVMINE